MGTQSTDQRIHVLNIMLYKNVIIAISFISSMFYLVQGNEILEKGKQISRLICSAVYGCKTKTSPEKGSCDFELAIFIMSSHQL